MALTSDPSRCRRPSGPVLCEDRRAVGGTASRRRWALGWGRGPSPLLGVLMDTAQADTGWHSCTRVAFIYWVLGLTRQSSTTGGREGSWQPP